MCAHVTRESLCEVGLARGGLEPQLFPSVEVSTVQEEMPVCVDRIMRTQAAL